jgi:hypothetical protein
MPINQVKSDLSIGEFIGLCVHPSHKVKSHERKAPGFSGRRGRANLKVLLTIGRIGPGFYELSPELAAAA